MTAAVFGYRAHDRLRRALPGRSWTASQHVAFWLGLWFIPEGIGAFLINAAFTRGTGTGDMSGWSPLFLHINGWHALFHLIPGLTGVAVATSAAWSRRWVGSVAVLYGMAGVWGLTVGDSAFGVVSVERFGSMIHLLEAAPAVWAVLHTAGVWRNRSRRVEIAWVVVGIAPLISATIAVLSMSHILHACCCGSC